MALNNLIDLILHSQKFQDYFLWGFSSPRNSWHSWDATPWDHPWLTSKNLSLMKSYSSNFFNKIKRDFENKKNNEFNYAFCGNMANALYLRSVPLRKLGLDISIFLHPQDNSIMSHPVWEEFDGVIKENQASITDFLKSHTNLSIPDKIYQDHPLKDLTKLNYKSKPGFISTKSLYKYYPYYSFLPTIEKLSKFSAILTSQSPYLAKLSGAPYIVAQNGGDIWFEASRDDIYGRLQREAFAKASIFIVSNPWSFAHARRYGFKHLAYLPLILDEEVYSPGHGQAREKWIKQYGGDFFILTTSRLDDEFKGSQIILDAFKMLIIKYPNVRLVCTSWGEDFQTFINSLEKMGIKNKVICLPLSGKARIRDYLRSSDCFLDQFVMGYYGSAGLEAMAMGKPVIAYIKEDQYNHLCKTSAPPVLNSKIADDIVYHLIPLIENRNYLFTLSEKTRSWFLSNHSSAVWKDDYRALLNMVAIKTKFPFTDSPLAKPLTQEELDYHHANLLKAPQFPNYTIG